MMIASISSSISASGLKAACLSCSEISPPGYEAWKMKLCLVHCLGFAASMMRAQSELFHDNALDHIQHFA